MACSMHSPGVSLQSLQETKLKKVRTRKPRHRHLHVKVEEALFTELPPFLSQTKDLVVDDQGLPNRSHVNEWFSEPLPHMQGSAAMLRNMHSPLKLGEESARDMVSSYVGV